MKRITFLFIGLFFTSLVQAQELNDGYLTAKLVSGYPSEASTFVENLSYVKSATLETGIDSVKFLFGSNEQEDEQRYWAIVIKNKKRSYESVPLQKSDSMDLLTHDVDFGLNNKSEKISVRILYDSNTNEVFYQWLNKEGSSKTATIQKVQRSIEENAPMPYFNVEALNGAPVTLDDFKGKFLVINWWQTTCAPCITEMPGLNELVEKFKTRADVEFISIAWDDKPKLEKFLKKRDFKYQQTLFNEEVASLFGRSFPKHIIVNPEGIVTYFFVGGYAEIHKDIENSLNSQLNN